MSSGSAASTTPTRWPQFGPALTAGFQAAIAVWIAGYFLGIPELGLPGPLVFAILCVVALGIAVRFGAARDRPESSSAGPIAGAIFAVVSLLAMGSVLTELGDAERQPALPLAAAGWIFAATLAFSLATVVGATLRRDARAGDQTSAGWLARLARTHVASVIALIVIGGVVTSTETGMAVPDWPATFGANMFLYPLSRMTGGVYYEHAHRLAGALIGLTTMALAISAWFVDGRRAIRVGAVGLFLFVVAQGALGGVRVLQDSPAFALVHGVSAQLFLACSVVFAAALAPTWRREHLRNVTDPLQFKLAIAAWIALLMQISLGAAARHFDHNLHGILSHAGFSIVPAILALIVGFRSLRFGAELPLFRKLGMGFAHATITQMALGLLALWAVLVNRDSDPLYEIIIATAHQTLGAVIFMLATLHVAWAARTRPVHSGSPPDMS